MNICTHRFDAHAIAIIQVRDTPELVLTNDVVVFIKTLMVIAATLGECTYRQRTSSFNTDSCRLLFVERISV